MYLKKTCGERAREREREIISTTETQRERGERKTDRHASSKRQTNRN